jgi:citrate synthase
MLPGFGHPPYPDGDPRAVALLERILPRFPPA